MEQMIKRQKAKYSIGCRSPEDGQLSIQNCRQATNDRQKSKWPEKAANTGD
jgi:hypothetical protein